MASAIVGEVADGREPGPQSPYETRLTGECSSCPRASISIADFPWEFDSQRIGEEQKLSALPLRKTIYFPVRQDEKNTNTL